MSKVSISGDQNGTGNFTIKAPNSNTDRTLTLPDEEGTVATIENIPPGYEDQDALDLFNVTGSAPVYACRAWVNFDGTGTVSIRESGNVSSITDNGTGRYTVNFATAMPDADYSMAQMARSSPEATFVYPASAPSSTSETPQLFVKAEGTGSLVDAEFVSITVFR